MTAPPTVYAALGLAASERGVFALRDDGAVFVLLRRGDVGPGGGVNVEPRWVPVPSVPGTLAAFEAAG